MPVDNEDNGGARFPPTEPGFEPEYLADFILVLGTERAIQWIDHLSAQLVVAFSSENHDSKELQDTAHAMISQAGTLGFVELARRSAKLEEAILAGGTYLDELDDVKLEAHRVSGALIRLKADLALGGGFSSK